METTIHLDMPWFTNELEQFNHGKAICIVCYLKENKIRYFAPDRIFVRVSDKYTKEKIVKETEHSLNIDINYNDETYK